MKGRLALVAATALSAVLAGSALAAPGEDDTPIADPDLERACGLDIHVILDESSSIGTQLAPNVRNAFRAFTTALKNTGSRMAVSEFSAVAGLPLAGAAQRQYTTVTDATIASVFEPYISGGYSPTGPTTLGTNWEDAFRIGRYFLPRPSSQPHLVVFITDGDPNKAIRADRVTYAPGNPSQAQNEYELKVPLDDSSETTSTGGDAAKDLAVSNANALKAQGSHILTVAVGQAIDNQASLARIVDVSGPDVFSGAGTFDVATDDVYRVPNFADLQAAMSEAAFQLCAPSVTVEKLVDLTPDPGTTSDAVPGAGWDVTATADPEPAEWVLPAGATGDTATATTDATGFASFQWTTAAPTSSDVQVRETPQPGFENDQSATRCTFRTPDQGDTPLPVDVTDGGFSGTVPNRAIVTCRLVNRALPAPSIEIEKTTNGADADDPPGLFIPLGDPVTWSYAVTNTGNVTLSSVAVTDDQGVPVSCPGTTIPPNQRIVCTATGSALGVAYANVGSVTAVDPFGTAVSDTDPSHYTGSIAGIDVEKETNGEDADDAPGPFIPTGAPVTWRYTVTNTGNSTLTDVTLVDDQLGTIACGSGTLAPGEQATCTATGTAAAGQYENLATASGVNDLGQTARDSDPSHYFGESASVDVEKSTNGQDADTAPGPSITAGDRVTWGYHVTNTGNVTLSPWSVTDDQGELLACPRLVALAPGRQVFCRGGGTARAGQYENTGTVTAGTPSGATVTDSDPSHYFGVAGAIDVEKLTNGEDADQAPGPVIAVGSPVTWAYQVTNTGNSDLTDVRVADFSAGVVVSCPQSTLAVGETITCTGTGVAAAGPYTNFSAALGTTPTGDVVSDSDPSNYFGAAPGILLEKATNGIDADEPPGPFIPVGEPVEWAYTVLNTGNDTLSDVTVTDDRGVDVDCPQTTLLPGERMTCTATGTATIGSYENTGSVTADDEAGGSVSDTDPSHYFGSVSEVHVEKLVVGVDADDPPGPDVIPGGTVTWRYELSNPGNVAIRNVELVDDDPAVTPQFVGGDEDDDTELDPGETWVYQATGTAAPGLYANTATVRGLDVLEDVLTDEDPAHHNGHVPPSPPGPPPPGPPVPSGLQPPESSRPSPRPERRRLRPRLVLRKTATETRVRSGQVVTFRLRVRNVGRATARRVRACDRLPSGLVLVSARGASLDDGRACFTVRRLRPQRSRTFVVRTRAVRAERDRTICNVAARSAQGVGVRRASACVRVLAEKARRPGGVTG